MISSEWLYAVLQIIRDYSILPICASSSLGSRPDVEYKIQHRAQKS